MGAKIMDVNRVWIEYKVTDQNNRNMLRCFVIWVE